MKYPLTRTLSVACTVAAFALTPVAVAHDKHHDSDQHNTFDHDPRGSSLRDEVRHARAMYDHVQDEIAAVGTDRHIRSEMGHINGELAHVDEELAYRTVDPEHIRAEVAHIHEELHHVEAELHERGARESDRGGVNVGGFHIRVR